jgi:hypothetical protein
LVPESLFTTVRWATTDNKAASTAIVNAFTKAKEAFMKFVWTPRNELMIELEKQHGITVSAKKSSSNRSSSNIHQSRPVDNRWMTWMHQALVSKKSWKGFPTTVNNLFNFIFSRF